jgi:hypothetical protein
MFNFFINHLIQLPFSDSLTFSLASFSYLFFTYFLFCFLPNKPPPMKGWWILKKVVFSSHSTKWTKWNVWNLKEKRESSYEKWNLLFSSFFFSLRKMKMLSFFCCCILFIDRLEKMRNLRKKKSEKMYVFYLNSKMCEV